MVLLEPVIVVLADLREEIQPLLLLNTVRRLYVQSSIGLHDLKHILDPEVGLLHGLHSENVLDRDDH